MAEISTGGRELPADDASWAKLAQSVLDRHPPGHGHYVEAAIVLAHFVIRATSAEREKVQLADGLSDSSARVTQLLEDRRVLREIIERVVRAAKIADVRNAEFKAAISALSTAALALV